MSKLLKNQEVLDEKTLAQHPGYFIHKMLVKNVDAIIKNRKRLDYVTLSRMKYDQLEAFYQVFGFRNEDNYEAPLTCRNIEVKRATTATMDEFVPTYAPILAKKDLMNKLDENIEELNIKNAAARDSAFNAIKNIKK
jgi:hypothetical protein